MRKYRAFLLLGIILAIIPLSVWYFRRLSQNPPAFDGERAYEDVLAQVAFGPRTAGSQAHADTINYIQNELQKAGWQFEIQETTWQGFPVKNIIASRSPQQPQVILGAHYDSRMVADKDPAPSAQRAVPGANDGASGVAVLLELARTLPTDTIPISLLFIDAEDDGGLDGRDWLMGSRAYVTALTFKPRAVIILDMIGDADLNINMERNSDQTIRSEIWALAKSLGYEQQFIPLVKYSMIDDHTPFLEAGIPAVDIIDFDYPYWHTSEDTADKVSAESLRIVGDTVLKWLLSQR